MNRHEKVEVIINANSDSYADNENFNSISQFMSKLEWIDGIDTYAFEIHFYPTYNLLDNNYSFENEYHSSTSNGKMPYEKYLTNEEIKSLSYFDYFGEKIYRLSIQDRPNYDWDYLRPTNLKLICVKLINYLKVNNLTNYNEETISELSKLVKVAEFCELKELEIIFNFDF